MVISPSGWLQLQEHRTSSCTDSNLPLVLSVQSPHLLSSITCVHTPNHFRHHSQGAPGRGPPLEGYPVGLNIMPQPLILLSLPYSFSLDLKAPAPPSCLLNNWPLLTSVGSIFSLNGTIQDCHHSLPKTSTFLVPPSLPKTRLCINSNPSPSTHTEGLLSTAGEGLPENPKSLGTGPIRHL